jgi:DNA invertase Pin-like site-specific DNA recombinase
MVWMAAEERRKISERTKAGMARQKSKGIHCGRPSNKIDEITSKKILEMWKKGDRELKIMRDLHISKNAILELIKGAVV